MKKGKFFPEILLFFFSVGFFVVQDPLTLSALIAVASYCLIYRSVEMISGCVVEIKARKDERISSLEEKLKGEIERVQIIELKLSSLRGE